MAMEDTLFIGDFPLEAPISVADSTFDYGRAKQTKVQEYHTHGTVHSNVLKAYISIYDPYIAHIIQVSEIL